DQACVAMLDNAPDPNAEAILLASLENGLKERGKGIGAVAGGGLFGDFAEMSEDDENASAPPVSEALAAAINTRYAAQPDDAVRVRLAMRVGNADAYERVKERAADSSLASGDRVD